MFLLNPLSIEVILLLARILLSSSTVSVLEISFLKIPWNFFPLNLMNFPYMHLCLDIQEQIEGWPCADFSSNLFFSVNLPCTFHPHPLLNAYFYLLIFPRFYECFKIYLLVKESPGRKAGQT